MAFSSWINRESESLSVWGRCAAHRSRLEERQFFSARYLLRVIEYKIEQKENLEEQLTYRLITSLLDIEKFPAELLARTCHQRWQVENTIDELKIHLLGGKTDVRSQKPRLVVQEVYGWLLGHWAVRVLMFQAATSAEVPPLRLSNTCTLRVIRRAVPKFQRLKSEELPLFSVG